jgi:hypothetical protein
MSVPPDHRIQPASTGGLPEMEMKTSGIIK